MSDLHVIPVRSRTERRAFLNLPWRLYEDDANWVPPLRHNQRLLAGFGKHPFYETAQSAAFLAVENGQPRGRVLAIINHAHNQKYNDRLGFFGFFECCNQSVVAEQLFHAANNWLRLHGLTAIRGPVNPSLNYECGLLVDGFDSAPLFMMTYNPPWYAELLAAVGFEQCHDLFAYWGHVDMVPTLSEKHARMHQAVIDRFGITVRAMDPRNLTRDVSAFLDLYNRSLEGSWGFVPLSHKEMLALSGSLRHLLVPELTRIAEVEGRPIGAIFGLLDFNPRVREINGRLLPFGFLRLLRRKDHLRRMRFVSANVLPEYQQWGVGLMLTREFLEPVLKGRIEEVEFSWVLESNHLSRRTLEKGGAQRYKTYRLYEMAIP